MFMTGRPAPLATATRSILSSLKMKCGRSWKAAVDRLYTFLALKEHDQKAYEALLSFGERYTKAWDEPVFGK